MGEGVGTQGKAWWGRPRGAWCWAAGALALLVLLLQSACATGSPMGGRMVGNSRYHQVTPSKGPDAKARAAEGRVAAEDEGAPPTDAPESTGVSAEEWVAEGGGAGSRVGDEGANSRPRRQARRTGEANEAEDWEGDGVGWPDGVGDGHPYAVPMTLDYFQGFLVQAGVPSTAVSEDGRMLSPRQAMELLPHLLSTPVTLGNFGLRRMAAHLLLEVATGGAPVSRDELHARMRRLSRLLVLRPDGYLVKPTTGGAVQKVGEVVLADDGTLRAGRFEVGPFYAIEGGCLFPVDEKL